jgi:hypothetical protein
MKFILRLSPFFYVQVRENELHNIIIIFKKCLCLKTTTWRDSTELFKHQLNLHSFLDKQQHLEFVALIPATCVITDLLLSLPLTPLTADFILALLNHMFSTTKETHVFVVEWKKPVDGKGK